ncbi:MAG TPA: isoleucine--tRNA ligase [Longimicrobiales bacterium]|nr:isoleucine--tRNA ligase [Longimicrobiales bacterium]
MKRYPDFPESVAELEESLLAEWQDERLFQRTLEERAGAPEWVFYEGPPTANGRPGIHHVLSRTLKDLMCRYRTMRGYHVTRIAGWDTHGLPVEIEAEKKLGISGKREIEEVGVARFNEVCRESVFTYKEEWERFSERIGYWLDYSHPYVTYHPEYVESVWWIVKQLANKGLLYRGYKSVPYCPRCGTALSSHEVAQGYEDVADPSLYFLAPVEDAAGRLDPERAFLVWTTTPWTLPSNVALAVDPDLDYAEVEADGRCYILAQARVPALFGEDANVVARLKGRDLLGMRYRRPFDLVRLNGAGAVAASGAGAAELSPNAWTVLPGDFVTAEDGTGIVHLAPAFGADDFAMGQKYDLPMLRPIDDAGRFLPEIPLVGGVFVKAADEQLVEALQERELVFRYSLEEHSYPHCWRCSSPLIYMARETWYARTTAVKEQMLANNAQVGWRPPEVGSGRFGEWLEGNVDWALSRDRYWGTPLPIWVCDRDPSHTEVIESFRQLALRAGPLPGASTPAQAGGAVAAAPGFDPHKPFIDEVTFACAHCDGTMRRTPEVIDVWFDSGAMPYAQWHYPFEHREEWQTHFPADFICEGVDQTRGWFYSLMAIATMLGDGPPYRNVIVNDLILDAEGQKMSKSRGNVVNPWDAIAEFGADAIRWYLVTVSQPWVPKRFDPVALAESARRVFDTLANTYRFFALYANLEDWRPSDADPAPERRSVLDRWILSRLAGLVATAGAALDDYDVTRAARAIGDFVVDDLSNWYIRRSRDRFWGNADEAATRAAFRTLHEVLATTAGLLAPITPFLADWYYRALAGGSVHLAYFPETPASLRDERLDDGMGHVRVLARLGRAAREAVKVRVRQPLRTLYAVVPGGARPTEELLEVLRDELNVKEVRFLDAAEELVTLRANPNFRVLGPRFGGRTQQAASLIRALPSEALAAFRRGEPTAIELDGERFELRPEELAVLEEARGELVVETDAGYTVALDPALDAALRAEGLARELVSRVQRFRRDSGLHVSDRIRLGIFGGDEVVAAARAFADYIGGETLALELEIGAEPADPGLYTVLQDVELDGVHARIGLAKIN